jgi:hypothetical protein
MKKRAIVAGCALTAAAFAVPAGAAVADGGGGRSFCSESGAPFGTAPASYGNAGEIISWIARNEGFDPDLPAPGLQVAAVCNPTR